MNTPLEDWKNLPEFLDATRVYFASPAGRMFLHVLQSLNKPQGSILPGQDGLIQNAMLNQNAVGYEKCLGNIAALMPDAIEETVRKATKQQEIARRRPYEYENPPAQP